MPPLRIEEAGLRSEAMTKDRLTLVLNSPVLKLNRNNSGSVQLLNPKPLDPRILNSRLRVGAARGAVGLLNARLVMSVVCFRRTAPAG